MPNWCTNEIIVTGLDAHRDAVRAMIIKDHNVDFEVIAPIPNILKPLVINDSKAAFELNRVMPNRLGSLTPDAFIKRMAELHKTAIYNNIEHSEYNCYEIENLDFEVSRANRCVFLKERSIEDSIEAYGKSTWYENREQSASGVEPILVLIHKIIHAMEKEYRDYKQDNGLVVTSQKEWCNKNWGTKWNADNDGMEHGNGNGSYFFMTASAPPTEWLAALTEKVAELKLEVEITMSYAEQGNRLGGVLSWTSDGGSLTETEMSDEDICEFLEISVEEYNE